MKFRVLVSALALVLATPLDAQYSVNMRDVDVRALSGGVCH